ncbi:hypothetical protein BGZ49_003794 [Haplosporangium sp. Z 27]|nr:hypothetical protein BGZ49_003794 [Haplosporangium sp. Z 27]
MTSVKVKLFCIIDGDSTAFSVKIEPEDTVDDLKDAIKIKQSPSFNDIQASNLVLWIVTIPIGEDNEEEDDKPILLEDHLPNAKKICAKQVATEICKILLKFST